MRPKLEATILDHTWEEWVEKFKPVRDEHGDIIYFDGDEEQFKNSDPATRWTNTCEGKGEWIHNGIYFINRVGHILTEVPWSVDEDITITVSEGE